MSDLRSFARYLSVAALVGAMTVGLRELLQALLPSVPGIYGWTMLVSYGVGVVLSYRAQGRFTFAATGHRPTAQGLRGFAVLATMSAVLTVMLAYVLRYGLSLDQSLPELAAALAFAGAALLTAPVSFLIARLAVFQTIAPQPLYQRESWWAWLILSASVLAHAVMVGQVALRYNPGAAHDEALFLGLARNLAAGEWLGPYSVMTLVKGPGFALWLAVVHALHVPVSLAAALSYALPCVVMFLALRPVLTSVAQRLAVFLVLLVSPVAFSGFLMSRELIYPALSLLMVGYGLGVVLRLDRSWQTIGPWCWAAGLGLASAMLVLTREEAIWMLPLWLFVGLQAIWAGCLGRLKWAELMAAGAVTSAFGLLPVLTVASLNYHHYGVLAVLELDSRPFISAYGALARVRADPAPQIPLPREAWQRVASVSPAFAELVVPLRGAVGQAWGQTTPSARGIGGRMDLDPDFRRLIAELLHQPTPPANLAGAEFMAQLYRRSEEAQRRFGAILGGDDSAASFFAPQSEIGGGGFLWALRDSAAALGYHQDARIAAEFYARLADEVNAACASHSLRCYPRRDTLRPVLHRNQLVPFGNALMAAASYLAAPPGLATGGGIGALGAPAALASASAFLHQELPTRTQTLPATEPIETLIAVYQTVLPWASSLALLGWLSMAPSLRRLFDRRQRLLWMMGGALLGLVLARLVVVALIHVTSWPAVFNLRYLAPAQPLLLLFDALAVLLLASLWPRCRRR
ncbi:MAG: GtrA family protein [Rhodoferax sp.]|nr:GtrA family protein [Rhodoferax sp.]